MVIPVSQSHWALSDVGRKKISNKVNRIRNFMAIG
jgi:hypothetical protein